MAYKLRLVQYFKAGKVKEFMDLERKFIALEETVPEFPKGRRFIPYSGKEPVNALIWESDFATIEEVQQALFFLENDSRHADLHNQQLAYFLDSFVEIYQSL